MSSTNTEIFLFRYGAATIAVAGINAWATGTPAYMSPEQASGVEADARSDLFSLGCVLYHCATGRRPFLGRDALSTLVAVTTIEPPAPRELNAALPDALNELIVSLLLKDRDRRPQTAHEVAEKLDGIRHQASGVRKKSL